MHLSYADLTMYFIFIGLWFLSLLTIIIMILSLRSRNQKSVSAMADNSLPVMGDDSFLIRSRNSGAHWIKIIGRQKGKLVILRDDGLSFLRTQETLDRLRVT